MQALHPSKQQDPRRPMSCEKGDPDIDMWAAISVIVLVAAVAVLFVYLLI